VKYRAMNLCLTVLITIATGSWTTTSSGQDDPNSNSNPAARQEYQIRRADAQLNEYAPGGKASKRYQSYASSGVGERPVVHVLVPASTTIRSAADAVLDAKSEEDKGAVQKKLADLLSKYFDDDMSEREKELGKIEERLTKLRELLDRRRTKKQEILDLQAKVALNEAEGLGFYNTEPQMKGFGSGFGRMMSGSGPLIAVPAEAGAELNVPRATATTAPPPVKTAPPAIPAASSAPKE
jgi:hypothetical protein